MSRTPLVICAALSLSFLANVASAQSLELVDQRVLNGTVIMTGNTLGLSGDVNDVLNVSPSFDQLFDRPGPYHSVNAFIADYTPVRTAPGWGPFTTGQWSQNFSWSELDLEGGRAVKMYLMWSGSCISEGDPRITSDDENISPFIEDAVSFSFPAGSGTSAVFVTPDSVEDHCGDSPDGYLAFADVTDVVAEWESGMYGVGSVPATQNLGPVSFAGWTLIAVVDDPSTFSEPNQISIYKGWTPTNNIDSGLVTEVDGFCYPDAGVLQSGRLLASSAEGDAIIFGDSLRFGRSQTLDEDDNMAGVGNHPQNFFGSQLNDINGLIIDGEVNGTYPDHNPWLSTDCFLEDDFDDVNDGIDPDCLKDGARQGWDVTNIPINDSVWNPNVLQGGDESAFIQPITTGDAYRILSFGLALPSVSASVSLDNSFNYDDTVTVNPGRGDFDNATFTVPLTNTGVVTATNLELEHDFPGNVSRVVSFSTRLNNGSTNSQSVSLSALGNGVALPSLAPGDTVTVIYTVEVDDNEPAIIDTRFQWRYRWAACGDVNQSTDVDSPSVPIDVDSCIDADLDGLCVEEEDDLGTSDNDRDSDDDGITDPDEVNNTNTNPADPDTDGDGIQDGTETGVRTSDVTSDTDLSVFVPDADVNTTTNPNVPDTDIGGTRDGVEDVNRNGRIDPGECNPNNPLDDATCTDADNDGLSDDAEDELGTDPFDDDTDDDGLLDGWEVVNGTDPLDSDTDSDGIPDGVEVGLTTPQGSDTDLGEFAADSDPSTTTNPRNDDTDEDGLDDGQEDADRDGRQDPGETDAEDDDTDNDGILDGNEADFGSDPLNRDTDSDGIDDGIEVGLTEPQGDDTDPDLFVADADPSTTTDPNDIDTDDGTVADGVEDANQNGRIDPFETDPNDPSDDLANDPDCDQDGLTDAEEEAAGTDPCDPDTDNDGLPDPIDGLNDSDGDGLIDALDTDSDNDGMPDGSEDRNGNGTVDPGETDPDVADYATGGACSTVPAGTPVGFGLILLALAGVRRRRNASFLVVAVGATAVVGASTASAQDEDTGPRIDVQRFDPIPQPDGFVRVMEPNLFGQGTWNFGVAGNYGLRPFQLSDQNGKRTQGIVDHMVGADFQASIVAVRGLQLGVNVPFLQWQGGPAADDGFGEALGGSGESFGFGDVSVYGQLAVLNQETHGLGLILAPRAVLPSGASGQFVGIDTFGLGGMAAIGRHLGDKGARFDLNVDYQVNLSSSSILNLHPDDELGVGLGVGLPLGASGWTFDIELTGRTSVSPFLFEEVGARMFSGRHSPLELNFGIRPRSNGLVKINAGGGPGLSPGFGTPVVRGYGLVRVSNARNDTDTDGDGLLDSVDACPEEPEDFDGWQDEDGCPDTDNDGDGIRDVDDRCPLVKEDPDGFEDLDGCPDDDNDADGIFDTVDECPLVPEVFNGVDDEDGCPEDDQDGDGLYDVIDQCPTNPEDFDNFEDEDGCPDTDNDEDGFLDANDACPNYPEDFDGWVDEDGCPDEDNDEDGFLDVDDTCPNEPETLNEFEDDDGCPDSLLAQIVGTQIIIMDKVYFDTNRSTIKPISFDILDAVHGVLDSHLEIAQVEVQGHTDSDGGEEYNLDLSQRRADAVREYLIQRGIDSTRLISRGFGEGMSIQPNTTAAGKADNRRVEFHILGQSE
jgi:MYXO-CTERM domain-containing protein